MNKDYIVYITYYDEKSKHSANELFGQYEWIRLLFNKSDKYLENNAYYSLMNIKDEWINKKYVGCLSISVCKKLGKSVEELVDFIETCIDKSDVISFAGSRGSFSRW